MTKEELEKATGQELIDERNYCGVDGYYGDYLDDVNAEMLKRFNRLAELEAQIEKMKNCKNCNKLKKEKDGLLVCTVGSFYTNVFGKNCDKWEIKENDIER